MDKPDIVEIDPNRTIAEYSAQLIKILSMWGFDRDTARRIAANMATTLRGMTDDDYQKVRAGMRIAGGMPQMGPANDEGIH